MWISEMATGECAGAEEHGVPEGEQPGVAEQEVVTDGV